MTEPATLLETATRDKHTGHFGGCVIVSHSCLALTALQVVDQNAAYIFVNWDDGQVRSASIIVKNTRTIWRCGRFAVKQTSGFHSFASQEKPIAEKLAEILSNLELRLPIRLTMTATSVRMLGQPVP